MGPGRAIEAAFEARCACDLRLVAAGDGAALLARLRLEAGRGGADVVLGLDTNLTAAAAATGLFAPHGVAGRFDLPVALDDDPLFLPFDWGWFAFVHDTDRLPVPPRSFAALAASDVTIVIQDPRSSTPGLGLVLWIEAAHGDRAGAIWAGLADNIVTVTPGWTEARNRRPRRLLPTSAIRGRAGGDPGRAGTLSAQECGAPRDRGDDPAPG